MIEVLTSSIRPAKSARGLNRLVAAWLRRVAGHLAAVFAVLAGILAQGIIASRPGERWRAARQLVNALELARQDFFVAGLESTDRWQDFKEGVRTARLNFGATYGRVISQHLPTTSRQACREPLT